MKLRWRKRAKPAKSFSLAARGTNFGKKVNPVGTCCEFGKCAWIATAMRCWCASTRLVLGFVTKDIAHAFSGHWAATEPLLCMLNGFSSRKKSTNRRNHDERDCVYGSEKAEARHPQGQFAGRDD